MDSHRDHHFQGSLIQKCRHLRQGTTQPGQDTKPLGPRYTLVLNKHLDVHVQVVVTGLSHILKLFERIQH